MNNNDSYNRGDNEYGYALYRDEIKAQKYNPDINIEQGEKKVILIGQSIKKMTSILVVMIVAMENNGTKNIN